jgi:hypothetical protein
MGLFSKLKDVLNPLSTKNPIANPGGYLVGNALGGGSSSSAQQAPAANPAATDPSGGSYYGDPNDPSYGSLTDPFTVEDFYNYADPGYSFRLQQGNQAVQNSAAAGSGAMSGAALKDLLTFNQDYASTEYGNAFNRYQTQQGNIFSRLSDIAKLGQNAAAGVGSAGTQLAGNAGQAVANAGTASGSGIVGAGNAIGQGATNYWLYNNPQLWQRPMSGGGAQPGFP